jgi:hypothetical protein
LRKSRVRVHLKWFGHSQFAFHDVEPVLMSSIAQSSSDCHIHRLEPCPPRPSQLLTDATSNLSTSACSKTSATGSSVTTSSVPAPAPSARSLSAIGVFRPTYHHPSSPFSENPFSKEYSRSPCARCGTRKGRAGAGT